MQNKKKNSIVTTAPHKPGTRAVINFTDRDIDIIESMAMNGKTMSEVADFYGFSEDTFKLNLHRTGNDVYKEAFYNGKAKAIASAAKSLRKISDGYYYTETETKYALRPMAEEYFHEHKGKFKILAEHGTFDAFIEAVLDGMVDVESGEIKKTEKYEKPDFRASTKILEAFEGNTWDLEAKHKSQPVKHLVVHIQGEPQRKRQVKADYVMESK